MRELKIVPGYACDADGNPMDKSLIPSAASMMGPPSVAPMTEEEKLALSFLERGEHSLARIALGGVFIQGEKGLFVVCMEKPMPSADGSVALRRIPDISSPALVNVPVGFLRQPVFIAHPANIRAHNGDQRLRLQFANEGVITRPIVYMTFSAGAVEPDFAYRAVVRQ